MTGFEAFLSAVLMIFILGVFVSFIVLMGLYRAQEIADRRLTERRSQRARPLETKEEPPV